jgi:DNA-binding transcriptional ArsR family regulator
MSNATIDQTFAALADPTRVDIVMRLSRGVATVGDLAEPFDMSLRAVLKHVQVLEAAGVVRTVKRGRVRLCELVPAPIDDASRWIDQLRRRWDRRLDRIEQHLKKEGKQ